MVCYTILGIVVRSDLFASVRSFDEVSTCVSTLVHLCCEFDVEETGTEDLVGSSTILVLRSFVLHGYGYSGGDVG